MGSGMERDHFKKTFSYRRENRHPIKMQSIFHEEKDQVKKTAGGICRGRGYWGKKKGQLKN